MSESVHVLALRKMNEDAAMNEVMIKLVSVLGDKNVFCQNDRVSKALGEMGEKTATNELITKLVSALGDENVFVRNRARQALEEMGENAATN